MLVALEDHSAMYFAKNIAAPAQVKEPPPCPFPLPAPLPVRKISARSTASSYAARSLQCHFASARDVALVVAAIVVGARTRPRRQA
ncbi:hypothetical protein L226DRAFT_569501 [Lentinus tigrinus ALCF2SS1-7]|uniref:uncharacterized protein n=1 Tax=Lentinus tigrinus ALCF2SS1-7 TaxID=1328758 RepID=UPI0011660609|nr:hypothetical protein L226DRAFT_569501 [Lentinus tigrinus ALCF2SS1-7]